MKRRTFAAALLLAFPMAAEAHETRPGYLELVQTGPEAYRVLWKVPARNDLRLGIYPRFPEGCRLGADPIVLANDESYAERSTMECPGGLIGKTIHIDGLVSTQTDVLVRLVRADGSVQTALLKPSSPSFRVRDTPGAWEVAATYLTLGVEHILFGIDHLLFVLALLFLVKGARRIFLTVTAFTVAHSLTLGSAALGIVTVPGPPVEAIIALSIVFVALEILRVRRGESSLTEQRPWIVAFTFGLLHGFGFAGALSEVGLPSQAIPLALLFFNLGVEAGQLLFIAAALGIAAAVRVTRRPLPKGAPAIPVYAIGSVAAFWTIDRIAAWLG